VSGFAFSIRCRQISSASQIPPDEIGPSFPPPYPDAIAAMQGYFHYIDIYVNFKINKRVPIKRTLSFYTWYCLQSKFQFRVPGPVHVTVEVKNVVESGRQKRGADVIADSSAAKPISRLVYSTMLFLQQYFLVKFQAVLHINYVKKSKEPACAGSHFAGVRSSCFSISCLSHLLFLVHD